MGFDMYLERRPKDLTKEQWSKREDSMFEETKDYSEYKEWHEEFSVYYWRKVNWLHGFVVNHFNDGVDDCNPIDLSRKDIEDILKRVNKVKEMLFKYKFVEQKRKDESKDDWHPEYEDKPNGLTIPIVWNLEKGHLDFPKDIPGDTVLFIQRDKWGELAQELPPSEGFFFGDYNYSNWYAHEIFETSTALTEVLKEWDDSYQYFYRASW